jgi:uncharacterized membrane protein
MASKYDTNPLDPDFPKKAGHSQQTETLPNLEVETKAFNGMPSAQMGEDPTRRYQNAYDNPNFAQYSSVYAEQQAGPMYQTTRFAEPEMPSDRKIIGLPEKVLMVLPYTPFYIGLIAGVLELLFVPQSETKSRFHAAQGLALHVAILAVSTVLGIISGFSKWASVGSAIFGIVTIVLLVISMIKVWKGKAVHYESLDGLTNWLSDKIKIQPKQ